MALGGGTFLVQNKVLPGAYINFVSRPRALGGLGERGTVCIPMLLDWGMNGMVTVESEKIQRECQCIFGYDFLADEMKNLREVFLYAKTVKVYRLNAGERAKATSEALTVMAKYGGVRGNDLKVVVAENVDEKSLFDVKTYLGAELLEVQTVGNIIELVENDFVIFSGSGALTKTAGMILTGGSNKEMTGAEYGKFLEDAEKENFQVLAYTGEDATTKKLFEMFTKRMRNQEGVKFVTVLFDYDAADFEGVISIKNETEEEKTSLVYWVAGATASANVNESLTNRIYNGAYTVMTKYKKSDFEKGLKAGGFFFYCDGDKVRVLTDINTFTSYEPSKSNDFSSNRVVRVLDSIANDVADIFSKYYLGKQSNNINGRNLFKTELIRYHEQLQSIEAIEGFKAEDIIVEQGVGKCDVVVYENVMPTDAMEKLYMKVEVV